MIGAYIAIVMGVAVWAVLVPLGKQLPEGVMRGITVFGGAFLLAVSLCGLLPEAVEQTEGCAPKLLPYGAVMAGFLVQQVLERLSAHAEHGHAEHVGTVAGLMIGLSLHALLEGMPLVDGSGEVNRGLLVGMLIHNVPVALILVGVLTARGYGFWRVLAMLAIFGAMSPVGSMVDLYVLKPTPHWQGCIMGAVAGVLLHVSSSILFDHRRNGFSWGNIGIMVAAFAAAYLAMD